MEKRLAIGTLIGFLGCRVPARFDTPLETVKTLEKAVAAKDWKLAGRCFSDEMRQENGPVVETRAFYLTDYWVGSVTAQNFLKPIPIISRTAGLKLTASDPEAATVEIEYPDRLDKDVRLRSVKLRRSAKGEWKIAELFGRVRGRGTGKPE